MAFYCVSIGEKEFRVRLSGGQVTVDGEPVQLKMHALNKTGLHVLWKGLEAQELYLRELSSQGARTVEVLLAGMRVSARVETLQQRMRRRSEAAAPAALAAPMPGLIVNVQAAVGEHVSAGQTLVVMESMKMQMQLRAPQSGKVAAVCVQAGQQVEKGADLVQLEPDKEPRER